MQVLVCRDLMTVQQLRANQKKKASMRSTHSLGREDGTRHRAEWHGNGNRGEELMRGRTTRRGGVGGLEKSCKEEKVSCEGKRVSRKKKKQNPIYSRDSFLVDFTTGIGDEVALLVLCVGHRRGWGVKCRA